jgi:hypothetical protein
MLPEKPLLFESFTGLTVQQFDDIFDKEIKKNIRERETGAGRPFILPKK